MRRVRPYELAEAAGRHRLAQLALEGLNRRRIVMTAQDKWTIALAPLDAERAIERNVEGRRPYAAGGLDGAINSHRWQTSIVAHIAKRDVQPLHRERTTPQTMTHAQILLHGINLSSRGVWREDRGMVEQTNQIW